MRPYVSLTLYLAFVVSSGSNRRGLFWSTNLRVPHISLVFREMWDTADFDL